MSKPKLPEFLRISFINPITKKNQFLKIKSSIIENADFFPFPISTQLEDKIITLYIDKQYKVRASDISNFLPNLINYKKNEVQCIDEDEEGEKKFQVVKNQLIQEQKDDDSYGELLMVGLFQVGKTSISNRLRSNLYNPDVRPTFGSNIVKVFVEELNFFIFDMGGQQNLRKQWYRSFPNLQAIIFVLNITQGEEEWDETAKEFQKIHEYYYNDIGIATQTPLLIFGNKIDLISEGPNTRKKILKTIMERLDLENLPINYHVKLTSALSNEGILPGFKWLVKNYINIKGEL